MSLSLEWWTPSKYSINNDSNASHISFFFSILFVQYFWCHIIWSSKSSSHWYKIREKWACPKSTILIFKVSGFTIMFSGFKSLCQMLSLFKYLTVLMSCAAIFDAWCSEIFWFSMIKSNNSLPSTCSSKMYSFVESLKISKILTTFEWSIFFRAKISWIIEWLCDLTFSKLITLTANFRFEFIFEEANFITPYLQTAINFAIV